MAKIIKIEGKEYNIIDSPDSQTFKEISGIIVLKEIPKPKIYPQVGEIYYVLEPSGDINPYIFTATPETYNNWEMGNGFFSKAEAEREQERRRIRWELKKISLDANQEKIDWKNYHQKKYCIEISKHEVKVTWHYSRSYLDSIYFLTEEAAIFAMNSIGKKRIFNAFNNE